MHRIIVTILTGMAIVFSLNAQEEVTASGVKNDSLSSGKILFTPTSASTYITDLVGMEHLWKPGTDSIKHILIRLVDQYNERYDSIEYRLSKSDYQAVNIRKVDTMQNDTLPLRWLNDSTFIIDTCELGREPLFVQKTVVKKILDSLVIVYDSTLADRYTNDSIIRIKDTIIDAKDFAIELIIDTALLDLNKIQLYQIKKGKVVPKLFPRRSRNLYHFLADGSKIVVSSPVKILVADKKSPFNIVPNEKLPDSLSSAVQTLLSYTYKRDSILLYLNGIEGAVTPFWLTAGDDELQRYWVKNKKNDSVSIWMGNANKSNITFMLEDDINVERIEKETYNVPFTNVIPLTQLVKVEPFKEIPVYWDFDFSSSFSLSQNLLSNWASGGENSVSSVLDLKGQTKYANKEAKTEWTGNGRLKYGSVITEEYGIRKNTDLFEINSKYNKELRKKIDFSALFYMKNQIAKGYNYPNDSVPVSKFLNPATFTIGAGLEYKPLKKTTINFSLLSYKNTFVLDTASINQTNHGIDEDKRAKQEMGGQLLIKNELTLLEDLKISNSMRLFSNYLDKPGNIDVEWEMDLEKQISLFFTVLLNIHIIYDDDILTPKLKDGEPIVLPDNSVKKIPQLQFKEYLGLTFLIKL